MTTEPAPTLEEVWRLFRETDRKMDRVDAQIAELSAELSRNMAEAWVAVREASQAAREASVAAAEASRSVAESNRRVDGLSARWGRFVENMVEPAVLKLFAARGIRLRQTFPRASAELDGEEMEIDILAVDGDVAVAVEAKSRLGIAEIDEFLEKLSRIKKFFPRYESVRLHGAVAGIDFPKNVALYAYRSGLFVIRQSGDAVVITNDEKFRPAVW
jgi:hypothetical protein